MLRGINLGPNRRIPMADLRQLLTDAGFEDVKTYVQSGNIALSATAKPAQLERELAALIEERFGFAVPVVVRSRRQLQAVVKRDPIPGAADAPKLYQVTFLAAKPSAAAVTRLRELARESERIEVAGREIYTFHARRRGGLEAGGRGRRQGPGRERHLAQLDDGQPAA